jgi:sensor histidine kinase YesM
VYGDDFNGMTIAPLLLIPFVENAFKHVSHFSERINEIKIELSRKGDVFQFCVFNTKDRKVNQSTENGGIGLKNVQRRLDLLYKEKYKLEILESDENFEIKLQLKIV